jgi:hypothetical protein
VGTSHEISSRESRETGRGSQLYRHYTDELGRSGIMTQGRILPGRNGRLYVTPDLYKTGEVARQRLGLSRTPTGYFEIPGGRLKQLTEPIVGAGGGLECWVLTPVPADELAWRPIPK